VAALTLVLVWRPPGVERAAEQPLVRQLLDAPGPLRLRWAQAEAQLEHHLQRRPADAEAWVLLGWVRALQGKVREGAAIARYGASLDPQRAALRAEAARLERLVKH
jgi:cytochrome c-type biogenesis protein CcmH/NrfG